MLSPLTSRYWDLDQLVIENYKINYWLRYEPSKTHTKAIYLAFMRSPFVSRDSFLKTNRFATEKGHIDFISDLTFNDHIT